MNNTSIVNNDSTASTNPSAALLRAYNMACLGVKGVLELCVGPSLERLERAYKDYDIYCAGNDIDARWRHYYPKGTWEVGDALMIRWCVTHPSDCAVVFAPPLTRGCTGKREDALPISQVNPSYKDFFLEVDRRLDMGILVPKILCLVLPARSIATRQDRTEFFELLNKASKYGKIYVEELKTGRRQIRKYVDIYIERK